MQTTATNRIETSLSSLSPREVEILYWIAEGKGSKEIAATLHLSVHTVQKHTKNIYRKLDVHNKIEALNKTKWLIASLYRNRN
ncbi:MAG: LuxR family transcriptional regulator [Chitinophagaceae bacterium]|nr:MAG: LuxR family transcriptional regulator [Chitinophagaceae bacterium]